MTKDPTPVPTGHRCPMAKKLGGDNHHWLCGVKLLGALWDLCKYCGTCKRQRPSKNPDAPRYFRLTQQQLREALNA